MGNGLIDRGIIREVKGKLGLLKKESGNETAFRAALDRGKFKFIQDEANAHSFKIEHPECAGTVGAYDTHSGGKDCKKGKSAIVEAFAWGKSNIDISGGLGKDDVVGLASRIDYDIDIGDYRNQGVRVKGFGSIPPSPHKVRVSEMPQFFDELNGLLSCRDLAHDLEAAAYSHLHLARIHPFIDGNGRTARALQNLILLDRGIPVPVIYSGERGDYYDKLEDAMESYKQRKGDPETDHVYQKGEKRFYDFIAGRVSASLDRAINGAKENGKGH